MCAGSAMRLWDLVFAEGDAALLRAPVAILAVHEAAQEAARGAAQETEGAPIPAFEFSGRSRRN